MAEVVGSAVVQETVSRFTSYLFSKHDDDIKKASRGHDIERLKMAHTELALALERSARMPIMDVALLRRRKLLKRAFKDCGDLIQRCCKQRVPEVGGIEQAVPPARSSFSKQIAYVTKWSISSCFSLFCKDSICCSDVRRYEWFAECANRFLRDVESGYSPHRYMFSNPLVRQLLQGEILEYKMVQGSILRCLHIWPMCLEGHGVEVTLEFLNEDCKTLMRNFAMVLMLRLTESTDIVGVAIRCLQSFTSSFKHVAEVVMGELVILPLQDFSRSHTAPCLSIQNLPSHDTHFWRPDPLCCNPYSCAGYKIHSELSCKFPEQVILIHVECYESTSECNSLQSAAHIAGGDVVGDWPTMKMGVGFAPHFSIKCIQGIIAFEEIGGKVERIDDGLHHIDGTVRSRAINHYICQPDLTDYRLSWYPGHGAVYFIVKKPGIEMARAPRSKGRSMIPRAAKRRRSN